MFRDLHLYRRMQVLCRRIQTCPPFVCFLFRRIGVCYRRLASVRTSSLLRFRIPALRLLINPASRSPQSKQTASIAKKCPRVAPQPQERLSDSELTSLNLPYLLSISASSYNRKSPHVASSIVPVYAAVGRVNCKSIIQRTLT